MSATQAIKQRLKDIHITQTELAKALGTTRQNLANKMSRDNLSSHDLYEIGKILGCALILKSEDGAEYVVKYEDTR